VEKAGGAPVEGAESVAIGSSVGYSSVAIMKDKILMDQRPVKDRLRSEILNDVRYERAFTAFRRGFLERNEAKHIQYMVSLACQCFNTEYVYAVSAEEQLALARLKENFTSIRDLIVYSMYQPLWTVRDAAMRLGIDNDDDAKEIYVRQICEPAEENEIKKTIPSFGVSADPVSQAVREQYEEFPYPRWNDLKLPAPRNFADAMLERFPFLAPAPDRDDVKILIAGCGTGYHPISIAAEYPSATVTAVDFSKSSLAYGIRQSRKYNVPNLKFLHGDILNLDMRGDMRAEFDVIEAVGVLHHMDDPVAGLLALRRALKPGGFMKLGLYSRRARANLEAAKELIHRRQIGRSARELRTVRQEIIQDASGLMKGPMEASDFYYTSGFRDLLCHAHEVAFTPAELKTLLKDTGTTLLGYRGIDKEARTEYVKRFPDDPYMRNFDLVDEYEADHPEMLHGNLQMFWVRAE
jgi:SAM-dependent methyltransferase